MSKSSEKIIKVHLVQILLQTIKNKSLVIPQSKCIYDIMKIVELMKPRIPFVDVAIIIILIRAFNEMVIELASGGYQLKIVTLHGKALRNCVAKTILLVLRNDSCNRYITAIRNAIDHKEPVVEKEYVEYYQNPQPFPVASASQFFPPQRAT
jgi:HJR/Mrr/RecB family endonuclease